MRSITRLQHNLIYFVNYTVSSVSSTSVKADWVTSHYKLVFHSFLIYYLPCVFSS